MKPFADVQMCGKFLMSFFEEGALIARLPVQVSLNGKARIFFRNFFVFVCLNLHP